MSSSVLSASVLILAVLIAFNESSPPGHSGQKSKRRATTTRNNPVPVVPNTVLSESAKVRGGTLPRSTPLLQNVTSGLENEQDGLPPAIIELKEFAGTWRLYGYYKFIAEDVEKVFSKKIANKLKDLFVIDWFKIQANSEVSLDYVVSTLAFDLKDAELGEVYTQVEQDNAISHKFYITGSTLVYELEAEYKKGKIFKTTERKKFVQTFEKISRGYDCEVKMFQTIKIEDKVVFEGKFYRAGSREELPLSKKAAFGEQLTRTALVGARGAGKAAKVGAQCVVTGCIGVPVMCGLAGIAAIVMGLELVFGGILYLLTPSFT